MCAKEIGIDAVADGKNALSGQGSTGEAVKSCKRVLVDRQVWFAGEEDICTLLRVERRERASAVDELVAALHHQVRVGAEHRQAPRGQSLKQRFIIRWRL